MWAFLELRVGLFLSFFSWGFFKKTFHHFTIYLFFYFKLDYIGHGIKGSQKVLCRVTISVRQANRFFQHICILYICIFQTQINALSSWFAVFWSSGTPAARMKSSADIYITFTYCTQHQLAIPPHQPNHSACKATEFYFKTHPFSCLKHWYLSNRVKISIQYQLIIKGRKG